MEADRLRELLARFVPAAELDEMLLDSVDRHLELLVRWNARINLTAVRAPEEMVRRHFGESLLAARELLTRDSELDVVDVGSGAGFPGLPLKYWAAAARVTLIEGHGKKATFLREVLRALGLTGVEVVNQRAEGVSRLASLVTMRAVERFEDSLQVAAGLVAPGGRLGLLIGAAQAERALSLLGEGASRRVELPDSERRVLLVWERPQTG